jgi:membrane fusion protein (multidrug efflux system)
MRFSWMTASILALAASTALTACKKKEEGAVEKAAPPPPLKVVTVTAAEAPSPQQLVLTGMVAADQRSEVTADTQGKVLNVMVERGQRVKMGAAVVQLDVRSSALAAREAQANLASARAQRELAEQECGRTKQLLEKGAITRSEYDRQTTQCTSALEQVSAAEARTQMMMKSVADGIVRAPFDGVVTQRNVSPGEFVSPGKPLFTLVDDDPLKIELSVPEAEVRAIKEGQEVELAAVAAPDKVAKAKITRIGAEIGRTRSLIVEARIEPGSGLVPGMFAEARVTTGEVPRPVVPKDAVVKRGKTWHAFVVAKGEAQDRIVQIAPAADPNKVAIVQGVAKGEKVITKVTEQITDGRSVAE